MKRNELKKVIKECERLMAAYPEDANLTEACEMRIAEAKQKMKELGK